MAVLKYAFVMLLAGCYSPDTPSCVLACTADSDCVSGQVCTTDHLCAASGTATCGAQALTDGGAVTGPDAGSGATQVTVHINVNGPGRVTITGGPTCNNLLSMPLDCMYQMPAGVELTFTANPYLKPFKDWSGECMNQANPCMATPTGPMMMVGAKFN